MGHAAKVKYAKYLGKVDDLKKFPGLKLLDGETLLRVQRLLDSTAVRFADAIGSKMCFVAGTKIHTKDGLKNIEDIRPGDMVLTRPEDAGENDREVYRPVVELFTTSPEELYHVTFETDDGRDETLSTTAGHPFYVVEREDFVFAKDLAAGDTLLLAGGRTAVVRGLRRESAPEGETFTTYNFSVAETKTYFVGEAGAWVHNTGAVCARLMIKFANRMDAGDKLGGIYEMLRVADGMKDKTAGKLHFNQALDALIDGQGGRKLSQAEVKEFKKWREIFGRRNTKKDDFLEWEAANRKYGQHRQGEITKWTEHIGEESRDGWHGHHGVQKMGQAGETRFWSDLSKDILEEYDIDWYAASNPGEKGVVIGHAPLYAKGQHSPATAKDIFARLRDVHKMPGDKSVKREAILDILRQIQKEARKRK